MREWLRHRDELLARGQKYCPRCDTIKPLDDFTRYAKNTDGRYSYCRVCHREKTRDGDAVRAAKKQVIKARKEKALVKAEALVGEVLPPAQGVTPPPPEMSRHAAELENLTGEAMAKLGSILRIKVSRQAKDFVAVTRIQADVSQSILGIAVKVDDQQLRRKANDGLGKLLEAIKEARLAKAG